VGGASRVQDCVYGGSVVPAEPHKRKTELRSWMWIRRIKHLQMMLSTRSHCYAFLNE